MARKRTKSDLEAVISKACDKLVYWQDQAWDLRVALKNLLASELWQDRPEVIAAKELIGKVEGEL